MDESPFGCYEEPTFFVSLDDIRFVFNRLDMDRRVRERELWRQRRYRGNLSRDPHARRREPKGTKSMLFDYHVTPDWVVATVHCLKHKDGSLGGSGLFDPKTLYLRDCTLKYSEAVDPQQLPAPYQHWLRQ